MGDLTSLNATNDDKLLTGTPKDQPISRGWKLTFLLLFFLIGLINNLG
jgi:hypothetical protein